MLLALALPDWLAFDGSAEVLAVAVPLLYVLSVLSALDAVMHARTPQGSTGWAIALVAFPLVAFPLYWIFGRSHFREYVRDMRALNSRADTFLDAADRRALAPYLLRPDDASPDHESTPDAATAARTDVPAPDPSVPAKPRPANGNDPVRHDEAHHDDPDQGDARGELQAFARLARLPLTRGNGARLLVDGDETFPAILKEIAQARRYVLVQFYILRDDALGQRMADALIERARAGVAVTVLYDDIGSFTLSRRYRRRLREAGVAISGFPGRSLLQRFRLNFRNHRKIVVVDGCVAFTGGFNVGDEYLHGTKKMGPWRDTHVRLTGPMVLALQRSFVQDWYFSTGEMPEGITWTPVPDDDEDRVGLILESGPADEIETCSLFYAHAIASAEHRVWIATPYFVPDDAVASALQVAALRGVDVRILMPRQSDSVIFKFVPYAYLPEVGRAGVKVSLYEPGFLHQKVMLVDDVYAIVSSANLDNRSFRLNFEITAFLYDRDFCADVERMLEADFAESTPIGPDDLHGRSFAFRVAVRVTRLFAPVL